MDGRIVFRAVLDDQLVPQPSTFHGQPVDLNALLHAAEMHVGDVVYATVAREGREGVGAQCTIVPGVEDETKVVAYAPHLGRSLTGKGYEPGEQVGVVLDKRLG